MAGVVIPLPLGGLATELGTTQERIRALEALRDGWQVQQTTITQTTSGTFTWAVVSGGPSMTVLVTDPNGVMAAWGGTGDCGGSGDNNYIFLGLYIDGLAPNAAGNPAQNVEAFTGPPLNGSWVEPSSTACSAMLLLPLALGAHTIEIGLSGNASCNTYSQWLAVGPIP